VDQVELGNIGNQCMSSLATCTFPIYTESDVKTFHVLFWHAE